MQTLLATKLLPPQLPHGHVVRQRLIDRLNTGIRGKLSLIHAPAGYGKTTLAAAWAAAQQQQHDGFAATWLTLEEYDNDPTRFLAYFIGAWQQIDPAIGVSLAELVRSGQLNPVPVEPFSVLNQLINELMDYPTPLALVLDDWHTIESGEIRRMLQYWVEHVPPHVHTVVTSRTLPDLPLARWRVRGQFTEISARELQFTEQEASQFLREAIKLDLTDEDVNRLAAATEGWIAALQLLALSLQDGADVAAQLDELASEDRYLVSYLVDEVLAQQPAALRDFLSATAILDRLSGPLCDAVTAGNNSQAVLATLEQRNVFVTSLGAQGGWYSYHPLLAGYLRKRMASAQPETYRLLQGRAFEWLVSHGSIEEAIYHGLEAERFDDVGKLLARRAEDSLWGSGRAATLVNWCRQLPEAVLAAHPKLALSFGWALAFLSGFEELAAYLRRLRPLLANHLDSAETCGELIALEAEVDLYRGDIDSVLRRLAAVDFAALSNPLLQATVRQVQGYALRLNGDAAAVASLQSARRLLDPNTDLALWVFAGCDLAEAYMIQGDLNAAASLYREILVALPPEQHLLNPVLDFAWIGYGSLLLRRNQLNDALDAVQRGLAIGRAAGRDRTVTRYGLEVMARIRQAQGAWDDTLELLEQIETDIRRRPNRRVRYQTEALRARLHLLQGDAETAVAWAASFVDDQPSFVTKFQHHQAQLVYARWLWHHDPEEALGCLASCREQAEANGWREQQLEIAVLQASAAHRLEQTAVALGHLREAIRLARPGGHLRLFVEQAVELAPLLRELARTGKPDPFVGRIQAAFLPAGVVTQPLIDPLTQREIEILQLIGDGLSNPEIASRLIVATGTVARHTNNIFGKLGVRNRTEATLRARRLGLI